MENLADKTLVMIVAPSAMGKSTIMNAVTEIDPRFHRLRSFTTRRPRANDEPGHYFYLTADQLATKRAAGEIITEATFPTTGQTYGTLIDSFRGNFCLLDALANSVETYRELGFKRTVTISLVAPAKSWRQWFHDRYPERTDEASQRLAEAKLSVSWSLQDPTTRWVINDDTPQTVARTLVNLVAQTDQSDAPAANETAEAILQLLNSGGM